jgi:putative hydrolase of the HAD superfamily
MKILDLQGISTIVFDFGGVIITLDRSESVRRFIAAGLENAEEFLDMYHPKGIFGEFENGDLTKEEFYEAVRKESGKFISNATIDDCIVAIGADVPASKLQLLEQLREQGYRVYLLSNTNPIMADWALSPTFSATGKPLNAYFDKLYLSFQLKCMKPGTAIFEKMIADSGLNPAKTLFVDDSPNNVKTAQALGFKTCQPENGEELGF